MNNVFVRSILFVLFATIFLSGCSDFDEMKSQRLLIQSESLMESGDEEQAIQSLNDLIAKFPRTQSGGVAKKHLDRILKQRERRERMEFAKVLDSYQQVLNGYQTLYAEYPRTISALKESGYFFDAEYLEEITPTKFQVYLWLKSDGSGYRVWCVNEEKDRGYAIESLGQRLVPFERDEIINKLKKRFKVITLSRKLVVLQQKS